LAEVVTTHYHQCQHYQHVTYAMTS